MALRYLERHSRMASWRTKTAPGWLTLLDAVLLLGGRGGGRHAARRRRAVQRGRHARHHSCRHELDSRDGARDSARRRRLHALSPP